MNHHWSAVYGNGPSLAREIAAEPRANQSANASTNGPGADVGSDLLIQLFRTQYRQLVRFCRIKVPERADAEDIVQAAFLNARRAYPDKGIEELRPLLFTLVRNGALDFVRSGEHRRRQISVELGEVADQVVCLKTASPEQQVIDADHLAIVETLMAAMPARRREALRLHRIEGLTHAEIARRLSITRQTVIMDIAEAVAELAEGLARAERRRIPPGD